MKAIHRNVSLITIAILTLLLSGCLSHWVIDTETRLQVVNTTEFLLADIRVIDPNGIEPDIHWNTDTLQPGEKGRVVTQELVGEFTFAISSRDSLCGQDSCWRTRNLGKQNVDGGSIQWRIRKSGSKLVVEAR